MMKSGFTLLLALIILAAAAMSADHAAATDNDGPSCPTGPGWETGADPWERAGITWCQHDRLDRAYQPEALRLLLRLFALTDFTAHPGNTPQSVIDTLGPGQSYSRIICTPGTTPSTGGAGQCAITDPDAYLDFHDFNGGAGICGPGKRFVYADGGNGGPTCAWEHEVVTCRPGNSEGLTGRRCLADWVLDINHQYWADLEATFIYPQAWLDGDHETCPSVIRTTDENGELTNVFVCD